jgi:hypothetical protein
MVLHPEDGKVLTTQSALARTSRTTQHHQEDGRASNTPTVLATRLNPAPLSPFVFTSTYNAVVVGSEVRNGITPALGPKDAFGFFNFGINSETDTICYARSLFLVSEIILVFI